MPFWSTANFLRARGQDKFIWLIEALNAGMSQKEIAEELHLSKARVSQICSKIFHVSYTLKQEAVDAVEFELGVLHTDHQKLHETVTKFGPARKDDDSGHLRLIKGADEG